MIPCDHGATTARRCTSPASWSTDFGNFCDRHAHDRRRARNYRRCPQRISAADHLEYARLAKRHEENEQAHAAAFGSGR